MEVSEELVIETLQDFVQQNNINQIYCTYEEYVDGKIIVDFSDNSYAIINHEEQEYIFQPACMGDWDMQFETFEHLKMAMETYFKYSNVSVIETKLDQSEENEILNPSGYKIIENELNKIPSKIKNLLIENNVELILYDGLINIEENKETYGKYNWHNKIITMDANNFSIEYALIHEIGHALDDILNLKTENIISSYEKSEVIYDNEHFNSSISEYIAQGIHEYYNNRLNKDTIIYKELNSILSMYK